MIVIIVHRVSRRIQGEEERREGKAFLPINTVQSLRNSEEEGEGLMLAITQRGAPKTGDVRGMHEKRRKASLVFRAIERGT